MVHACRNLAPTFATTKRMCIFCITLCICNTNTSRSEAEINCFCAENRYLVFVNNLIFGSWKFWKSTTPAKFEETPIRIHLFLLIFSVKALPRYPFLIHILSNSALPYVECRKTKKNASWHSRCMQMPFMYMLYRRYGTFGRAMARKKDEQWTPSLFGYVFFR